MFKLYYSPGSVALASHIALEEAGLDYEAVRISFESEDQRKPDYLSINPKGRVPALITDRGILTETPAILLFIAQSAPNAGLAPLDDIFDLARLQSFNNYLCATVHVVHAHRGRGARWADDPAAIEAMQRKVPQNGLECFQLIESMMFKGPWVMGETYSLCDAYFYTVARWLDGDKVDTSKLPKTMAHMQAMEARPAVKKVLNNHFD
jgi:glutathione S-transferase